MRASRSLPLLALFSVAMVGPFVVNGARAQTGPSTAGSEPMSTYAPCTTTPSQQDSDAARGAYMFAMRKYNESDYSTAIQSFKESYKLDCNKHELLIPIARMYELLGNRAEAVHALETYLERVPNASDAETQRKKIANLKALMGAGTASASARTSPLMR